MAAGLLRQLCSEMAEEVEVKSAGLWPGDALAPNALEAMREVGIDISSDYPKLLTPALVEWADFILCLDPRYAGVVEDKFPRAEARVSSLPTPISDPYGGSLSKYRECRAVLREELAQFVRDLHGAR